MNEKKKQQTEIVLIMLNIKPKHVIFLSSHPALGKKERGVFPCVNCVNIPLSLKGKRIKTCQGLLYVDMSGRGQRSQQ